MLLSKKVKIPPWSPWFDIYPGSQAIHFGWKNYSDFVRTAFQIGSSLRFNLGWWQWFRMVTAIQLFLEVQCIDVTKPKIVSFMWGSYGLSFRLLKEMDSYSYEFSTLSSRMPLKLIFVYVSRVFTAPSLWNAYFVATKPLGSFSLCWPPPGLDFVETSLGGRWQSVAICSVQKNRWKGLEIIGSFQLLSSLSNWYPGRISAHDGSFSLWSIFFAQKITTKRVTWA